MNIICSQCNKDDAIQKVSAVVAGGHASGSFSGYSGGAVNIDGKWGSTSSYTTLGGSSASDLARALAPPPEPKKQSPGISVLGCIGSLLAIPFSCSCVILAYAIPMTILALFNSDFTSETVNFISGVASVFIFFCFCAALLWFLLKEAKKEKDKREKEIDIKFTAEKSSWENAMVKWNRLYYCHRDGIVLDVENGETCQPTQIKEFIYK